jgi:hypothetical protein
MTARQNRARPGDILEVSTPRGLAYIHYTARHPEYGDAIRPKDFTFLAASSEAYFTFYPAGAAVHHGLVQIVARIPVAPGKELPVCYRRRGASNREGRILTWFIWDGTKDTLVWELGEAEKHLPIASIWNHESLVYHLVHEWRPEQSIGVPKTVEKIAAKQEKSVHPDASTDDSNPQRVQHYLYFPSAKISKAVAAQLTAQGFKVDRRRSESGADWLVLVEHTVEPGELSLNFVIENLECLAQEHSGEYDGHQSTLVLPSE